MAKYIITIEAHIAILQAIVAELVAIADEEKEQGREMEFDVKAGDEVKTED